MGSDSCRPPEEFRQEIRALSERLILLVREVAHSRGYAIGVHGSMERDLDLIAVPWTEGAEMEISLLDSIQEAIGEAIGECYRSIGSEAKPHGRVAWFLHFQNAVVTPMGAFPFIDISVMPRVVSET